MKFHQSEHHDSKVRRPVLESPWSAVFKTTITFKFLTHSSVVLGCQRYFMIPAKSAKNDKNAQFSSEIPPIKKFPIIKKKVTPIFNIPKGIQKTIAISPKPIFAFFNSTHWGWWRWRWWWRSWSADTFQLSLLGPSSPPRNSTPSTPSCVFLNLLVWNPLHLVSKSESLAQWAPGAPRLDKQPIYSLSIHCLFRSQKNQAARHSRIEGRSQAACLKQAQKSNYLVIFRPFSTKIYNSIIQREAPLKLASPLFGHCP